MAKPKEVPASQAVKIDRSDYLRAVMEARKHERSVAQQIRIIFREWFEGRVSA